ncbi:helix-turn-helix transcriptional regulator [Pedobacter sp. ASV12]|uniref:helix-turn-helix transcriptional regulator n=1 Tax=Pedobacter sp. ASV12 TaxID=2795120 RepID=UPI0018EB76CF|nr:AraC family transcriptional regulator [Pedobacter sp. ASV12]
MSTKRIRIFKNEILNEFSINSSYTGISTKYMISLVSNGAVQYHLGKRGLTLFPQSFIFLNEGTSYTSQINSKETTNRFSVLLDPGFVCDYEYSVANKSHTLLDCPAYKDSKPVFLEAIYPLQGEIAAVLRQLKNNMESGQTNELVMAEYLNHCLESYYRFYRAEVTNRAESLNFLNKSTRTEILKRLSIAKDFINSNYNKNISLNDIALASCLSVNHLLRTFKQAYQMSPHQFLTQVRLRQAKYYLKHTDYQVSEIVDIIGFECQSSFTRLFRNSFQVTPKQYR